MFYKVLLVSVLAVSLMAFGQTSVVNQPQSQPVPAGSGLSSTGGTVGYYGEGVGLAGPLLTTPTAGFDSPQPTAGISDAGRAGISDSTPTNEGVQATLNNSTLVYSSAGVEGPATVNPATSAVTETRSRDLGPSFFSEKIGPSEASGPSLAEIADRYRNQGTQTVRTYTNADVRPAHTTAADEERLLAANKPPALPQAMAKEAAQTPASAPQSTAATQPAQSPSGNEHLPASASPLPLLGLLGLLSTGAGLWLRGTSHRIIGKAR